MKKETPTPPKVLHNFITDLEARAREMKQTPTPRANSKFIKE